MNSSTPLLRVSPAHACISAMLIALAMPAHALTPKAFAAQVAAMPAAPSLKLEDLQRRSRLREVRISPDGSQLTFLASEDKVTSLNVLDTKTGKIRQLLPNAGRAGLSWSTDGSAIFVETPNAITMVLAADGGSTLITALDTKLEQQLYAVDPGSARAVLVEEWDHKTYRLTRVDADGKRSTVYEGGKKLNDLLLDEKGEVSFIKTLDTDFSQVVSHKEGGKWIEAARCLRLRACNLTSAAADQRSFTMIVNHDGDRRALVEVNVATKAQRLLHSDPQHYADLRSVVLDQKTRQPLLASYELPQRRTYAIDPRASLAANDIAAHFTSTNVAASPSSGRWLLTETAANLTQERFWLYDPATHGFEEVLKEEREKGRPVPAPEQGQKLAIDYRASDGALVHGYLTLPPGKDASKIPLVTMVHGGPWASFTSDYHWLVQWLANKGVAVFQPNFRSSTGYGDKYMRAPGEDFGNGRVQKDIIEGVQYLQANGVGDKARLAIIGDSFGGYATLMALTHTPDMFAFGLATMPPVEFARTIKATASASGGEDVPFAVRLQDLGIRYQDAQAMQAIAAASPEANAARVVRPLVILAGAKDDKVDIASVNAYAAHLQNMDKKVTLLVDPDEGHNPRKPILRAAYLHLLEGMMHRYLGMAAPAAASPDLAAYLAQTVKANTALP